MTYKNYSKELIINFLNIFKKKSLIVNDTPDFMKAPFREKVVLLKDPFIKKHCLELIDNGFTVVENSVPIDLIENSVSDFNDWKRRNKTKFHESFYKYDDKLDRIINLQSVLPIFSEMFSKNKALSVQDFLFQRKTCLYSSLFFEVGSSQDIHRDIPLFWTNPGYLYFGTWLALEDTNSKNGPLLVIPGSHKLGLFNRQELLKEYKGDKSKIHSTDQDLWNIYQKKVQSECKKNNLAEIEVHVKKGDTIIWHPMLAHGGKKILDKSLTRLSNVIHTTPENIPVFHIDTFFDLKKKVPVNAPWKYKDVNNRKIRDFGGLSITHDKKFDFKTLV